MRTNEARAAAIKAGLSFYETGRPCRNGHVSKRWVSNHNCVECAKAQNDRYWSTRPEKRKQVKQRHYAKNSEEILASNRRWRDANKAEVLASCKSYRDANKEAIGRGVKAWQQANPEKVRLYSRNREALRVSAQGFHTVEDIEAIRRAQKDKCAICRVRLKGKGHVDHIVALSKGGSNWPRNLQFLCAPCNTSKGARHPLEFAQSKGLLL